MCNHSWLAKMLTVVIWVKQMCILIVFLTNVFDFFWNYKGNTIYKIFKIVSLCSKSNLLIFPDTCMYVNLLLSTLKQTIVSE